MKATSKVSSSKLTATASVENFNSSEEDSPVVRQKVSTKARKSWKKPAGMPRRPLSAYNLFFQDQRKKLLGGVEGEANDLACSKRKHRKTHGKIGFADLAKSISQTWHDLTKEEKHKYENEAKVRKEDYFQQLRDYKKNKLSTEQETASNRDEDEDRSDYAAVLVSMSRSAPGHSKGQLQSVEVSQAKDKVQSSISSFEVDSIQDRQRRMLEDSIMRQLNSDRFVASTFTNLRQECNIPGVTMHLAHGLPRNNAMMMNSNHGLLASVPMMNNTSLRQSTHPHQKTGSVLHPELLKPPHSGIISVGGPGENVLQLIDPRQISQSHDTKSPGTAQQLVAKCLLSSPPVLSSIRFGDLSSPLPVQQSFAGNILQQRPSDMQKLILLSRLQSQGIPLQHTSH